MTLETTEYATVHTACEVSFAVGHADYGTINVPVGTKVFRHLSDGKPVSDWFLEGDEIPKLCPEKGKIYDKPSIGYIRDAFHYGITMPNANVKRDGVTKPTHEAIHI